MAFRAFHVCIHVKLQRPFNLYISLKRSFSPANVQKLNGQIKVADRRAPDMVNPSKK